MQVQSTVKHRQTTSGYLTTLLILHQKHSERYGQLASDLVDRPEFLSLTNSLGQYHSNQASAIKELLSDMSPSPVKPNGDMFAEDKAITSQTLSNDVSLLKYLKTQEENTADYYRTALDNNGIPDALLARLEKMSERNQEVVSKLGRIISSGVERDMSV